jgi:hypothetical protein
MQQQCAVAYSSSTAVAEHCTACCPIQPAAGPSQNTCCSCQPPSAVPDDHRGLTPHGQKHHRRKTTRFNTARPQHSSSTQVSQKFQHTTGAPPRPPMVPAALAHARGCGQCQHTCQTLHHHTTYKPPYLSSLHTCRGAKPNKFFQRMGQNSTQGGGQAQVSNHATGRRAHQRHPKGATARPHVLCAGSVHASRHKRHAQHQHTMAPCPPLGLLQQRGQVASGRAPGCPIPAACHWHVTGTRGTSKLSAVTSMPPRTHATHEGDTTSSSNRLPGARSTSTARSVDSATGS